MKIQSFVFAALVCTLGLVSFNAMAAVKSVASINENKASLAGQSVTAHGQVVKVNNGIMQRNFVHVRDGSGDSSSNNLVVTSKQTAKVGDMVTISGIVTTNKDFGSGYSYPLLIENASIVVE